MTAQRSPQVIDETVPPVSTATTPTIDGYGPLDHKKDGSINTIDTNVPAQKELLDNSALARDDFPDGGLRAWMVVLGAFMTSLSTWGLVNSWGVFQAYYETTLLKDANPSAIAWIGSIQYALMFFPALISGRLFDLGYFHIPYATSSILLVISVFLTAQCTEYWHFLLCQGIAQGLAGGMTYGFTNGVLAHWFLKKRGMALGLVAVGSSTGGTVFPILSRNLISIIGFQWTMRVVGFVILFALIISNLTLRRRLPPKYVEGGLINPRAFKNPAYTVYCISLLVSFLGFYTVLTYIDVSATAVGIPSDFSFYLISIANAGSALGRFTGALLVDRYGSLNILTPCGVLTAILTFVWPYVKSKGGFIGLAIPYGFSAGMIISTFMLPVFGMGEIEDVGRRTGMTSSITAIGALAGLPISGAIISATGTYEFASIYAGCACLLAVVLFITTRYFLLGRKFVGKC